MPKNISNPELRRTIILRDAHLKSCEIQERNYRHVTQSAENTLHDLNDKIDSMQGKNK